MADENETSPAEAVEVAPQTHAETVERDEPRDDNERAAKANAGEAENVETTENADGEQVTVEELEFDVGGTKHKIKKGTPIEDVHELVQKYQKGLESKLQRESQTIASKAKAIEEAEKVATRLQALGLEQAKDMARGTQLAETIAYYERPDIQAALSQLWSSNPDEARRHSDAAHAARAEFQQIESRIAQYGTQRNEAERQTVEIHSREGEAVVAKAIKGFSPQVEAELVEYAKKHGVSEESAKKWRLNPYGAITTWKAMQFDKMQAASKAAAKPPAPTAAPVTSIKGGKGTSNGTVDLERMSMDDYAAYMAKREGRRASR